MKIKNYFIAIFFSAIAFFSTSCNTTVAPDACFKVTDTLGNEISSAKLNQPIYFLNCGDKYVLNAVYPGISQPLPLNTVNPITGYQTDGKPMVYGLTGSVGVVIPANNTDRDSTSLYNKPCLKFVYGDVTTVTGAFTIVYVASNVGNDGKDVKRSTKSVSFTVKPDSQ